MIKKEFDDDEGMNDHLRTPNLPRRKRRNDF